MAVPRLDDWLPNPAVRTHHRRSSLVDADELWRAALGLQLSDTVALGRLIRWRIPDTRPASPSASCFEAIPSPCSRRTGACWCRGCAVASGRSRATIPLSPVRMRSETGASRGRCGCCSPTGSSRPVPGEVELVSEARVGAARPRCRAEAARPLGGGGSLRAVGGLGGARRGGQAGGDLLAELQPRERRTRVDDGSASPAQAQSRSRPPAAAASATRSAAVRAREPAEGGERARPTPPRAPAGGGRSASSPASRGLRSIPACGRAEAEGRSRDRRGEPPPRWAPDGRPAAVPARRRRPRPGHRRETHRPVPTTSVRRSPDPSSSPRRPGLRPGADAGRPGGPRRVPRRRAAPGASTAPARARGVRAERSQRSPGPAAGGGKRGVDPMVLVQSQAQPLQRAFEDLGGRDAEAVWVALCRLGDGVAHEPARVGRQRHQGPASPRTPADPAQDDEHAALGDIHDAPVVTLHARAVVAPRIAEGRIGPAAAVGDGEARHGAQATSADAAAATRRARATATSSGGRGFVL